MVHLLFFKVTICILIHDRFFDCTEARDVVGFFIINLSIQYITTSWSSLLLLFGLLLLFLSKGSFKFFLFLLEFNKSLSLFLNISWIIPVLLIRWSKWSLTIADFTFLNDCSCSSSVSFFSHQSSFGLLTSNLHCISRWSNSLNWSTGSITSAQLGFNNFVLFFGGEFSTKFCLFDLDSNINSLCVEISVCTIHIFQMIRFNVLGLFFRKMLMTISQRLNNWLSFIIFQNRKQYPFSKISRSYFDTSLQIESIIFSSTYHREHKMCLP